MERIGDEVERELGRFGPAGGMRRVVAAWPEAVGGAIARNAWPARRGRDGTLHVSVSSSAWAFELSQLAGEIGARLAHALGEAEPVRLRFAPGPLPERGGESVERVRRDSPHPSAGERAEAGRIAATVTDPALRDLVERAVAASLAGRSADRRL